MPALLTQKIVANLPQVLVANTIYYVRKSAGFDLYLTNDQGIVVAYPLNKSRVVAKTLLVDYSNTSDTFEIVVVDPLINETDNVLVFHGNYLETDENSIEFLNGLTFGCLVSNGSITIIGISNFAVNGEIKILYQIN